jgi:hypothetical protein
MRSAGNFSPEWGYLAPAPSFMRTARVVLVATAVGATAGAGVVLSLADRPAADSTKTMIAAHAIVTSAQAAAPVGSSTYSSLPMAGTVPVAAAPPNNATVSTPSPAPAQIAAQTPPQTPVQAPPQVASQIQAEQSLPPQRNVASPGVAQPTVANQSAAIAPAQPSTVGASAEISVSTPNTTSAPAVPGIASLSADSVSTDAAPDAATVTPAQVPPQKKKHSATSKNKSAPGFGSAIQRLFTAHAGPSYYPNRGL